MDTLGRAVLSVAAGAALALATWLGRKRHRRRRENAFRAEVELRTYRRIMLLGRSDSAAGSPHTMTQDAEAAATSRGAALLPLFIGVVGVATTFVALPALVPHAGAPALPMTSETVPAVASSVSPVAPSLPTATEDPFKPPEPRPK